MAKITIEILSSRGLRRNLHVFDKEDVSIGRGYGNDLVLQDPYVSARHLIIRFSEHEKFSVEDLNSRNGSFILSGRKELPKKKKITETTEVISGSSLSLGNAVIRVFSCDHPVPLAKPMVRTKRSIFSITRKTTTLCAIIGYFLLYLFESTLRNDYTYYSIGALVFMETLGLLLLVVWSGVWALAGRMIRHKTRFRLHLTVACLFAIVIIPIRNICGYLGFMFANPYAEGISLMILCSAAGAILLFEHLRYATLFGRQARVISALLVPISLCAVICFGYLTLTGRFSPMPPYYSRLKPPLIRPVKVSTIDDFVVNLGKVFEVARDKTSMKHLR